MQLDDARWTGLLGGYGTPYDPRPALRRLAEGDAAAWDELWQELHHQGDVGEASYAAVPELVRIHLRRGEADWNAYALTAIIEEARRVGGNPDLPEWLRADYEAAWQDLQSAALAEFPAGRRRRAGPQPYCRPRPCQRLAEPCAAGDADGGRAGGDAERAWLRRALALSPVALCSAAVD